MLLNKNRVLSFAALFAFCWVSANARTYQLSKVMVINEVGQGGFAHTGQINFTSNYIKNYLAPKYGFKVTTPANQAAIDAVFRDDSLSTYDVVVFNGGARIGGTGALGDTGAQFAFQRWLKHGGGLVAIHATLDHNDTWPWLRDSVFGGTKLTVHSAWSASGKDATAQVQWDTLETNGTLNSLKPEYDSLRACFPPLHTSFTYPDEWYSLNLNPRPYVDVLLTIDENSYTVPAGGTMGVGHPVAWAYHLPPDSDGNMGRFIYNERGHDVGAWDGTSVNHAPISPEPVDGIVYSDTSHDLMTKGFLWQSIRWAAGLMLDTSSSNPPIPADTNPPPSNLSYSENPASYTLDSTIEDNIPTLTGVVNGYSVYPALPEGLLLEPTTGVISGIPTKITSSKNYMVTASNSRGFTTAVLTFSVQSAPTPDSGVAKPSRSYRLKKVMIINETGAGGFARTTQINFTSNYLSTYLGPKYGFTCTIPANQAAIDAVFRDDSLSTYDVVVFNGGTRIGGVGAIGDTGAQHAFQRWLKHGGGLVGVVGLMDHNDTWPWLRDSVLSGTKFTVHSTWGAGGKDGTAKVQWDTLKTNGVLNSMKPEYDSLRACFPPLHTSFTYPDEWYSFSVNPRPYADVLLTIDENTYTVPAGGTMGVGHPVAWAYHLPPDENGNVGRFIYNERGHDVGAWDGTSTNHAPISPEPVNGIVYSDTSKDLMTKGFFWQSIRWAAGLTQDSGLVGQGGVTAVRSAMSTPVTGFKVWQQGGFLKVKASGTEKISVEVFDLSGNQITKQPGEGNREYSFGNLKHSSVYLIRVKAGKQNYNKRVLF